MTRIYGWIIAAFLLPSSFVFAQEKNVETKEIKWYTIEEAIQLNEKSPKKIFIDVYTDWCGWCKVMDKNTFSQPRIAELLTTYYYPVKFNAEQKDSIVFKGKTYKFVGSGMRGYHELAASILSGQMSYPTVVYMDEQMNVIQPIAGYQEPKQIEPILKFFGTGAYRETPWEEYLKNFKSEL
jgi:thioredoxin-related protein